jgi:hypothetical protein
MMVIVFGVEGAGVDAAPVAGSWTVERAERLAVRLAVRPPVGEARALNRADDEAVAAPAWMLRSTADNGLVAVARPTASTATTMLLANTV